MPSPGLPQSRVAFLGPALQLHAQKKVRACAKKKNQTRKASPRHRPVRGPSVASNPPLPDCPAAAPKLPRPPIPSRRRAPTPPPLLLPPILGSRTAAPCTSSGRRAPAPPPNLGMGMLGSGTVHLEEHAWDPRLLVASADQSLAKKSPAANPPSSPPPSLPTPSRCFLASRRGCGGPQGANIIAPSHPCLSLCLIVSRTFYHYVRACVRRQHGGRTACRTRRREPRMDFVQRPHAVMFIDTNVLDTSMTVSLSRSSPLKSMWASSSSDSQSPSPSTAKAACYGHGPYGTTGEAPVQERPARMPPN